MIIMDKEGHPPLIRVWHSLGRLRVIKSLFPIFKMLDMPDYSSGGIEREKNNLTNKKHIKSNLSEGEIQCCGHVIV